MVYVAPLTTSKLKPGMLSLMSARTRLIGAE